jgi:hypothetical protein
VPERHRRYGPSPSPVPLRILRSLRRGTPGAVAGSGDYQACTGRRRPVRRSVSQRVSSVCIQIVLVAAY